ncbi:unnamed protein product [Nippostrongylus brasiliensis]|uniref:Sigma70_r4 domain-containing protein n=1 Tax=Nippostrongylus brasiliensis TaxID=27835 RepID=A0A0N4YN22_NIPBR|nr:unnamed protein product [Nippostrongylus brasiliensis]
MTGVPRVVHVDVELSDETDSWSILDSDDWEEFDQSELLDGGLSLPDLEEARFARCLGMAKLHKRVLTVYGKLREQEHILAEVMSKNAGQRAEIRKAIDAAFEMRIFASQPGYSGGARAVG